MDINELIAIVKKKLQSEIDIENIVIEDKSFLHRIILVIKKANFI